MRVLITGATGYIGSNLTKALCDRTDHRVSIVKRPTSKMKTLEGYHDRIFAYDLEDRARNICDIINEEKPEIVIHLATAFIRQHTHDQIEEMVESNIEFPTKLIDALNMAGIKKFINTGTFTEYLNSQPKYDPCNLYSASKRSFEDMLKYYVNDRGFSAISLKLFDVYGPHDTRPKLLNLLKQHLTSQSLLNFSSGEKTIDMTFIEDAVNAYIKAVDFLANQEGPFYEELFIGSGHSLKLREVIDTFEEVMGAQLNMNWGELKGGRENVSVVADIAKAESLLQWKPRFSFRDGMTEIKEKEKL